MPHILQSTDREAYNQYMRKYREKNRKKIRLYNRLYNQKWRRKNGIEESTNEWKKKNKHKILVQNKAQRALRAGKLKREYCVICKQKAQMHHNNYDKPLEVIWLCSKHHKWLHNIINEKALKKWTEKKTIKFLTSLDKIKD